MFEGELLSALEESRFGPGGYRYVDFVRIGGPLTLVYWIVASLLIPRIFPF